MSATASVMVDTHCHLDFESFAADLDEVVRRAMASGVARMLVPGLDLGNAAAVIALAERYDSVYAAVGVHPNSSADWQDDGIETLRRYATHPKVVAIGEIGLDYYWDKSPKAKQHRAFAAQLELAAELGLPVIVHNRDAAGDVLRLLEASPLAGRDRPGVLHSFSADWATADQALSMGFYLGFTGPLTFKKAEDLRSVAAQTPPERLLVETDAPFLAPHPHRGRRNEPAYVGFVVERLAELHGLPAEEMARRTTANARRLFGMGLDNGEALQ